MKTLSVALSKAASFASLACIIHCAMTPLALLAFPFMTASFLGEFNTFFEALFSETIEWLTLIVMGLLSGLSLVIAYPVHRDARPMYWSIVGFGLFTVPIFWNIHGGIEEVMWEIFGACLITFASFKNRWLCHCPTCHIEERAGVTSALSRDLPRILSDQEKN